MSGLPEGGLYAITDSSLTLAGHLAMAVERAIVGGAVMIQYRDKGGDPDERRQQALAVLQICRRHRVPLIINDDAPLARQVGADGVHVGKDDLALGAARRLLGQDAIIGVSCYNRPERALIAQNEGADYVAFGRFFTSSSKPAAVQARPAMLAQVRSRIRVPIVAIGGITPENGLALIQAGADMIAVIHGVFGQPNPQSAAARYAALFR